MVFMFMFGEKLKAQSRMFSVESFSGIRIKHMTKKVLDKTDKLPIDKDSHLVVVVGTNNVKSDGSVMIMKKYKELIKATKTIECRKVTVVDIFGRTDITRFVESKIISVNKKLEALCQELGVEFLAPAEFYKKIGDARKWNTGILNLLQEAWWTEEVCV